LFRIGIKQPKWKELTDLDSARSFCEEVSQYFVTKKDNFRFFYRIFVLLRNVVQEGTGTYRTLNVQCLFDTSSQLKGKGKGKVVYKNCFILFQ
jgi:hypothetical protein